MEKRKFDNITLMCLNCVESEQGVKALKYSCRAFEFGRVILFSHYKPKNITDDIEFILIPKLNHITSCYFMLKEVYKYIKSDYVLSIHDDGFIINPHLWTDEFLDYDYIGPPWPPIYNHRVGNGGFCLRSLKFMELCQSLKWQGEHDDGHTCITHHDYFVENGCKFAPLELAYRFGLESKIPECEYNLDNCFGFHGRGEVRDVFGDEGQQFKDKIKLLEIYD